MVKRALEEDKVLDRQLAHKMMKLKKRKKSGEFLFFRFTHIQVGQSVRLLGEVQESNKSFAEHITTEKVPQQVQIDSPPPHSQARLLDDERRKRAEGRKEREEGGVVVLPCRHHYWASLPFRSETLSFSSPFFLKWGSPD